MILKTQRHLASVVLLSVLFWSVLPAPAATGMTFTQSPSSSTENKTASLVGATVDFRDGKMIIKLTTEDTPDVKWNQVYIDADLNKDTGRRHLANGEEGAEFLMEGSTLYYWYGGGDQKGWHWKPMDPAVSAELVSEEGNVVSITLPMDSMKIKKGDRIRLVIEIKTPGWEKTEDTLPREGAWIVEVN